VYYTVVYRDIWRFAMRRRSLPVIIEDLLGKGPSETFADVLEPGQIWELISSSSGARVWRKVIFPPLDETSVRYAYEENASRTSPLRLQTPYRLVEWTASAKVWEDLIHDQHVTELNAGWSQVARGPHDVRLVRNTRQIAATETVISDSSHLTTKAVIGGRAIDALIDSGAQGNYISPSTIGKYGFPLQMKQRPYQLMVVDGSTIGDKGGMITRETVFLRMNIGSHSEEIMFDVVPIGKHQIILGTPWMRKHNPELDWASNDVRFTRCDCQGSHK
jgi:hypothetical protein